MSQLVHAAVILSLLVLGTACTPKSKKGLHEHSSKANQHKAHSLINIEINSASPLFSGTEGVRLLASVTARPNITTPLSFEWILPEGSEVISGDQQGTLGTPLAEAGESLALELRLPKGSKAPVLSVSTEMNGARIGNARSWSPSSEQSQNSGLKVHSAKPHRSGKKLIF